MTEINDMRSAGDFRGITFSKFKKSDVAKELLNSLIHSRIEPACYWSAELICAGHYSDLWETIILFYSKHVHSGNPKIAIYLELRITNFRELVNNGFKGEELRLRNNSRIRRLFCELMCVLCDAKRRHSFDNIKISKEAMVVKSEESFVTLEKDDPEELATPLNEIVHNIRNKNCLGACHWIEWLLDYKNEKRERRMYPVEPKLQMDAIWLLWDIFTDESAKSTNKLIPKVISSLLTMFTLKYSTGCVRRRKYLLYFAVSLLCDGIHSEEEILRDKTVVSNILGNIDLIYEQIKKNEITPNTEYLFKDVKTYNLEKTIEKLETMNSFGEKFIPRI
jgi:hypothetical protein